MTACPSRAGLIVVALVAPLVVAGSWACSGPSERRTVEGLVVEVVGSSPAHVERFTLRSSDGQLLSFTVGTVELDEPAFPPAHLREHQAVAELVEVTYQQDGDRLVAVRLEDVE